MRSPAASWICKLPCKIPLVHTVKGETVETCKCESFLSQETLHLSADCENQSFIWSYLLVMMWLPCLLGFCEVTYKKPTKVCLNGRCWRKWSWLRGSVSEPTLTRTHAVAKKEPVLTWLQYLVVTLPFRLLIYNSSTAQHNSAEFRMFQFSSSRLLWPFQQDFFYALREASFGTLLLYKCLPPLMYSPGLA